MKPTILLSTLILFALHTITHAQTAALGTWKMIDDKTGEAKSHVKLYERNGKVYGKVVKTLVPSANHLCDRCTGYRKNKPMLGMVVIEGLEKKDGYLQNGKVLFPKQGKWYDVEAWVKPGNRDVLVLRGYWGPIYRTQYWYRVSENDMGKGSLLRKLKIKSLKSKIKRKCKTQNVKR